MDATGYTGCLRAGVVRRTGALAGTCDVHSCTAGRSIEVLRMRWGARPFPSGPLKNLADAFATTPLRHAEANLTCFLYQRIRSVERNALCAGQVERAVASRWCSVWRQASGTPPQTPLISDWPVAHPEGRCKHVNERQTEEALEAIRRCVARGQPRGGGQWSYRTAEQLGLEPTLRAPHRPTKRTRTNDPPNQSNKRSFSPLASEHSPFSKHARRSGAPRKRGCAIRSHGRAMQSAMEWGRQDSNPRPSDYESPALTTELRPLACGASV